MVMCSRKFLFMIWMIYWGWWMFENNIATYPRFCRRWYSAAMHNLLASLLKLSENLTF